MALLWVILQSLILIAALSLFGQFIVGIFNWGRRHDNFVYQLFSILTKPVVRLVRAVTPRVIIDGHVPAVAFLILIIAYFAVGFAHRDACMANINQAGCARWAEAWGVNR
ncbi:MAG: hypothetical protein ING59_18340 [Burkholderiales bacterium]|jgi:uncharacterized protein YggT (Ycf19 family)|nr:hypothetical protein [Burkholderiales bacterium]